MRLTDMQRRCVEALRKMPNGQGSLTEIANALKTNRLAVSSAMNALHRRDLASGFPGGNDQWSRTIWFLKEPIKTPNARVQPPAAPERSGGVDGRLEHLVGPQLPEGE